MRVAMLTGGGDCPGLNAVMRAVARKGERVYGDELVGFLDGWKGMLEDRLVPLGVEQLRGTLPRGGTIIGSSRTNPYKVDGGSEQVRRPSPSTASTRSWPSAARTPSAWPTSWRRRASPSSACPRRSTTTSSATELHLRLRHRGADLRRRHRPPAHDRGEPRPRDGRRGHGSPRRPHRAWAGHRRWRHDHPHPRAAASTSRRCARRSATGTPRRKRLASIVVVAEGATPKEGTMELQSGEVDAFGHVRLGGIGMARGRADRGPHRLRDPRHHPRPRAARRHADRVRPGAGPRFGVAAIDAVHDEAWGTMVALQAGHVVRVPLADAVGELKLVDPELYGVAQVFFE